MGGGGWASPENHPYKSLSGGQDWSTQPLAPLGQVRLDCKESELEFGLVWQGREHGIKSSLELSLASECLDWVDAADGEGQAVPG